MSAVSLYLGNSLLNLVLRGSAFTPPAAISVALYTADTGQLDTSNHLNEAANSGGSAYARQTATFAAAANGQAANDAEVLFQNMPSAEITHVALVDSATLGSGNVLFWGELSNARLVNFGDSIIFAIGDLVAELL